MNTKEASMGMDLILLPVDHYDQSWGYSHSLLSVGRSSNLFDKIRKLPSFDVPKDFSSYTSRDDKYEEPHYGKTIEDCYGDKIKFVEVLKLLKLKNHRDIKDNQQNEAIWAYLEMLPVDTRIALFWH